MSKNFLRIGAFIIDAALFNSIITFIMSPVIDQIKIGTNIFKDMFAIAILLSVYIIMMSLYGIITNKFFNGTIGKVLLGLKVTDEKGYKLEMGTSFNREFMKWGYFYATLGIYAIWCLYNLFKNQEMYHDVKNHTKVN